MVYVFIFYFIFIFVSFQSVLFHPTLVQALITFDLHYDNSSRQPTFLVCLFPVSPTNTTHLGSWTYVIYVHKPPVTPSQTERRTGICTQQSRTFPNLPYFATFFSLHCRLRPPPSRFPETNCKPPCVSSPWTPWHVLPIVFILAPEHTGSFTASLTALCTQITFVTSRR